MKTDPVILARIQEPCPCPILWLVESQALFCLELA